MRKLPRSSDRVRGGAAPASRRVGGAVGMRLVARPAIGQRVNDPPGAHAEPQSSRARALTFSPDNIRCTADSSNSRLKTRLAASHISSPLENCPLFHCLILGVHSKITPSEFQAIERVACAC